MASITIQPNTTEGNDCYISNDDIVHNEDYIATGSVNGGELATLIKFDLSDIPSGSTITSAELSIYQYYNVGTPPAHTLYAYRLKRATTETATTWTKYDGVNAWQTSGAFGENDIDITASGSGSGSSSLGWVTITLNNDDVKEMVDGDFTNNGFKIYYAGGTGNNAPLYRSSDYTGDASLRPKLVIDYTEGSVGIAASKRIINC